MLTFENINVWFEHNHVLKNINFHVKEGDFVVIVGTNGAGKSTLFDTIAGKTVPKSGHIYLDNKDITGLNELQRAGIITRIFQNTRLNSVGSMKVIQNLALAGYSKKRVRLCNGMHDMPLKKAQKIIAELGMDSSILNKPMHALSGGQRQLIAFAMATQAIPKVLLLDEPTAALDPQAATTLLSYANQFIKKNNITTLLITHDPQIALNLGNKIWILENGTISKQLEKKEKEQLNSDTLIGHIDYAKIAA